MTNVLLRVIVHVRIEDGPHPEDQFIPFAFAITNRRRHAVEIAGYDMRVRGERFLERHTFSIDDNRLGAEPLPVRVEPHETVLVEFVIGINDLPMILDSTKFVVEFTSTEKMYCSTKDLREQCHNWITDFEYRFDQEKQDVIPKPHFLVENGLPRDDVAFLLNMRNRCKPTAKERTRETILKIRRFFS